jgi:PadR family transcriptional regulator, regulatory protein AphA
VVEPTTTSYAVLGLLSVQPFTTYQLAKQMERVLRDVWPRAGSVIYEEPKRLVAWGWATAAVDHVGRRASTTYAITAAGRRALRRWLRDAGAAPVLEFEALLKVAFADAGDLASLQRQLAAIRALADERASYVAGRVSEYAETGGPFPERLPVIALVARFQEEQAAALQRWAAWAEAEVAEWGGVTPRTGAGTPSFLGDG